MLAFLVLSACANSGLGQPDGTEDTCPWVGAWSLVDVACGSFGDFGPFFERYQDAELLVAAVPEGCAVQITLRSTECAASERWTVGLDAEDPSLGDLESSGIIDCSPTGCGFDGGAVCLPGAGAGTTSVVARSEGSELVLEGALGAVGDGLNCDLGLVATFAAAP